MRFARHNRKQMIGIVADLPFLSAGIAYANCSDRVVSRVCDHPRSNDHSSEVSDATGGARFASQPLVGIALFDLCKSCDSPRHRREVAQPAPQTRKNPNRDMIHA